MITAFVALAIASIAQTTSEEYDYLTKGYKEDIASGRGVMKGYQLKHINSVYESNASVEVQVVYRLKDTLREKAAYLLIYKNATADSEYFCSPSPKSDTATIGRYWKQLNDNAKLDSIKKSLITTAVKKIVCWPNDLKDTTEKFIIEPSTVITDSQNGWKKFLEKNLNGFVPSENGAPAGTYTVNVTYIVDKNGMMLDVFAENNPGYGTAEEAVRVIKKLPIESPAQQDGKVVLFKGKQKITFVIFEDNTPYHKQKDIFIPARANDAKEWAKYVNDNFCKAVPYYNGAPSGIYSVDIVFNIDSVGNICYVKAENDPGYGIAEEGVRVISNSPNWVPATRNGVATSSRSKYTITFDIKR